MNAQISQIDDPFAHVEARRLEMINAASEQERALLQRIADAKQRALDLRGDADKLARNFNQKQAGALRTEAATLEDTARTLTAVNLRNLKIEQENIRQNRHPALAALMTSANLKARSSQADQQRNAQNALVSARAAFSAHLVKIATRETLSLAQDVAAAAAAANVEIDSLVLAMLPAPKQAA
jgi:hypothetical protein